jgi:SAM-dependent methyltransferase
MQDAELSANAFTDKGFWTPQTQMLRSIFTWVTQSRGFEAATGLSIDTNPTLDEIVLKRWPKLEISRAIYPEMDCQRLVHLADNSFDLVYSHQVLEHVPKPWLAGSELVRVLKRGGLGIHTTCAYNPLHGPPAFNDYYRFFPDGLIELFDGVEVLVKEGWGNREAILNNVGVDDGHGGLGGRRFHPTVGQRNEASHPWVTWIIFKKN